jgi:hypothetical protein
MKEKADVATATPPDSPAAGPVEWNRLFLACLGAFTLGTATAPWAAMLFLGYGASSDSWTATVAGLAFLLYAFKALPATWSMITSGVAQKSTKDVLTLLATAATMNQTKH